MKKAITFVLAAALTVSLAGCSSPQKETEKVTEKVTEAVTEAVTETETEAVTEAAETEEVTEAGTEEATEAAETEEAGTEGAAETEEATEAAETEEVTEATETEEATEAAETEEVTEEMTAGAETKEFAEEAETEELTEEVTEAAETEEVTEEAAEEAETEEVTEAAETEEVTEEMTEEAETEEVTEEAETEEVTEEAETEEAAEEAETEEVTEAAETEEAETEEVTEAATEEAETEELTGEATKEDESEMTVSVIGGADAPTTLAVSGDEEETEEATEEAETEEVTEEAETEEATEAAKTEEATEEAETEEATEAAETEEVTEEAETEEMTEEAETEEVTEAAEAESETEEAAEEVTEAETEAEEFTVPEGTKYKAVLLVNGTLGDKSFFDSANAGLEALQEELGEDVFEFKVEEMGGTSADMANYEPIMYDYCDDGSYDVIICGAYQVLEALTNAANDYPDQNFIFFDEAFDFEACENENVYNVMFKQNEVSYLVGAAAAMMTTDESLEKIDPDNKVIGFLGGMDGSVINDFLVGYVEGAKSVEPDIEVAIAYVGDYVDSAKGKDMAMTQYQNGADVGFNVAGSAGLGQIEAAAEEDRYAFGVDSDQAALLPDYAEYIPTSALKNVGNALISAIKRDIMEELPYGTLEYMGFAEGGVELVEDEHYEEIVPEEIRTAVADIQEQIEDGEIVVSSTLGENPISEEDYDALIDSVKVN